MKNLVFVVAVFLCLQANSQDSTAKTAITYKSYTSFPAFPLLALDSTKFNSASIFSKNEPMVVIYFSPTCSHCQHQAEEITSHMKTFKDVKFLMVSAYALQDIRQFAETYGINHFTNITIGYDPNFSMGHFFELRSLPGIFLYDKKGLFKKHFETNVLADTLINAIKE